MAGSGPHRGGWRSVRGAPLSKEISKVKKTLFAMAALAITAAVPASALNTDAIPSTTQATYNVAQAYPCTVGGYPTVRGISDLFTWCGGTKTSVPLTGGAAPGNLCLARTGNFLNVNCFVVKPVVVGRTFECSVQAYRLIKEVPGSFKCPDVYGLPHFDDKGNLIP